MACAAEHAAFNFMAITAAAAMVQRQEGKPIDGSPIAMGAAAACLPSLPDILEPAVKPSEVFLQRDLCGNPWLLHAPRLQVGNRR